MEPTRRVGGIDVWEPDPARDPSAVMMHDERPLLEYKPGRGWCLLLPDFNDHEIGGAPNEVDWAIRRAVDVYERWKFASIVVPLDDAGG